MFSLLTPVHNFSLVQGLHGNQAATPSRKSCSRQPLHVRLALSAAAEVSSNGTVLQFPATLGLFNKLFVHFESKWADYHLYNSCHMENKVFTSLLKNIFIPNVLFHALYSFLTV